MVTGFFLFHDALSFFAFGVNVLRKLVCDLGGLCFCRGYNVGIDVAGGACLGVSKVFGNNHQRGPVRDQEAGVCVAE